MTEPRRETCSIEGKDIFTTKEEARRWRAVTRRLHKGRGKVYRCPWGDHYHVTKGLTGNKGKEHRG